MKTLKSIFFSGIVMILLNSSACGNNIVAEEEFAEVIAGTQWELNHILIKYKDVTGIYGSEYYHTRYLTADSSAYDLYNSNRDLFMILHNDGKFVYTKLVGKNGQVSQDVEYEIHYLGSDDYLINNRNDADFSFSKGIFEENNNTLDGQTTILKDVSPEEFSNNIPGFNGEIPSETDVEVSLLYKKLN